MKFVAKEKVSGSESQQIVLLAATSVWVTARVSQDFAASLMTILFAVLSGLVITEVVHFLSTSWQQAEAALAAQLEEHALLLENIPTQIWYLTDEETYGAVNQAHADFLGMAKCDLEHRRLREFLDPDVATVCIEGNREVFSSGLPLHTEECLIDPTGDLRVLAITKTPKLNADGAVEHIICAAEDITERKRAEAALRESEEQYRYLVENQGEGLGIVDAEEYFIFANCAAHEIFGVPDGLIGRNMREFVTLGDFAIIRAQTERRRAGEQSSYEVEIVRPDGGKRTLLITVTPRYDAAGVFAGGVGIFRDITDRKQAERALRESEEKYHRLVENLTDVVFTLDRDGYFVYISPAVRQLWGYEPDEIPGWLNITRLR